MPGGPEEYEAIGRKRLIEFTRSCVARGRCETINPLERRNSLDVLAARVEIALLGLLGEKQMKKKSKEKPLESSPALVRELVRGTLAR